MNKQEFTQLRDLLIKYSDDCSRWHDMDSVDWLIEEIEKNGLELEHSQLTSTQEWWEGLSREEQLEIQNADGPDKYLPIKKQ